MLAVSFVFALTYQWQVTNFQSTQKLQQQLFHNDIRNTPIPVDLQQPIQLHPSYPRLLLFLWPFISRDFSHFCGQDYYLQGNSVSIFFLQT